MKVKTFNLSVCLARIAMVALAMSGASMAGSPKLPGPQDTGTTIVRDGYSGCTGLLVPCPSYGCQLNGDETSCVQCYAFGTYGITSANMGQALNGIDYTENHGRVACSEYFTGPLVFGDCSGCNTLAGYCSSYYQGIPCQ